MPAIVHAIHIYDGQSGQLLFRDAFQAAEVDAVHPANWSLGADAVGTDAAYAAKVVLVLSGVEEVLRKFVAACKKADAAFAGDCRPEPVSPADGAVASKGRLREIEVCLESNRAAMARAEVGLEHF